jgi:hypothetical protein
MPGRSYFVFKRPLTAGAEPDLSVVRRAEQAPADPPAPASPPDDVQIISV